MKALISGTRVAQLVADGDEFPVAPPFDWVDAPEGVTEQHTYENGQFIPPSGPDPKTRRELKADIDRAAGHARARFVSQGALVDQEYAQAEAQAAAFKAAGYTGDVPPSVQSWADAANMTPQQAADDILATAKAWRDVLDQVRALRLQGKAAIDAAADADIESEAQIYIDQLNAIQPSDAQQE